MRLERDRHLDQGEAMPLLQLEPFVFPETLLTEPMADDGPAWLVLHTRPRTEKALARRMAQQRLPFFLPLYKKQWRNQGRLFSSYLPAFPGYLFVRGDGDVRQAALETNLVAGVLPVPDQQQLHGDLMRIFRLIDSGLPLSPEQHLPEGTVVEITSGVLEGMEGRVIRHGKGLRLFVEVKFLQQGVSAEVESWMVRVLRGPEPRYVPGTASGAMLLA
jgi:transcription antitermination factor NusG